MKASRQVLLLMFLALMPACAMEESEAQIRGAHDLRCPEEQVNVQDIGGHAYRVKGCGRLATYLCISKNNGEVYCSRERDASEDYD
ncbi:MAG: hypothetical protein R3B13_33425 [Polyangiaceae bacterium]